MHVRFFEVDLLRGKELLVLNRTCMFGSAASRSETEAFL